MIGGSRYVHSPIGLPIPSRTNGFGMKREGECQMLLDPTLTHSSMWGGNSFTSSSLGSSSQPGGRVPFPVTPFNTPLQGPTYMVAAPDLKSFFLSSNSYASSSSADNPTLSMMIKEELPDLDTDLETMKVNTQNPTTTTTTTTTTNSSQFKTNSPKVSSQKFLKS